MTFKVMDLVGGTIMPPVKLTMNWKLFVMGEVITVVVPVGAAVEDRAVMLLVLLLAKLVFTGVNVVGVVSVPPEYKEKLPVKFDSKFKATPMPPVMDDIYMIVLGLLLATWSVMLTLPPSSVSVPEFCAEKANKAPDLLAPDSGGPIIPGAA